MSEILRLDPDIIKVMEEEFKAARLRGAWHRWRVESCVEFNNGHSWRFGVSQGEMKLYCAHGCPVTGEDVYPCAYEAMALDVPVTLEPWGYTDNYSGESDGGLNIWIDQ